MIGSISMPTGSAGNVSLSVSDIGAPGLGAFDVTVAFNPAIVSFVGCSPGVAVCAQPAAGVVDLAGVPGTQGSFLLANLSFRCEEEGTTTLLVQAEVFHYTDSTPGSPHPIPVQIGNGFISCS
jgi:hypothetical protein